MGQKHFNHAAGRNMPATPLSQAHQVSPRILFVASAFFLAGCASTAKDAAAKDPQPNTAQAGSEDAHANAAAKRAAHPPMPDASVIVTKLDGLTVHTVMGPEAVLAVTSHVLETSDHLVVVDTQLTTTHSAQLRTLCDQLNKPIAHLLLSHGHPDHYFGLTAFDDVPAAAFPETRRYIGKRHKGHQAMHKTMEGPLIPDDIVQPTVDLAPGELVVDGVSINVERVRGGEDVEQALIWLPGQNAVIAQDLVSNGYHAFFGTGPLDAWLATLDRIAATSPGVVFAGHGPPGDAAVLSSTGDYLKAAFALAETATTKAELITTVMDAYPERKGRFLVEVSALIVFRDRARAGR